MKLHEATHEVYISLFWADELWQASIEAHRIGEDTASLEVDSDWHIRADDAIAVAMTRLCVLVGATAGA